MDTTKITQKLDSFKEVLLRWASSKDDIKNIALAGSQAHGTARPDSDIDLVILTTAAEAYRKDLSWLEYFGPVRRVEVQPFGILTAVRAWTEKFGEVEFGFVAPVWADTPIDSGTERVVTDGIKVWLDCDGKLSALLE